LLLREVDEHRRAKETLSSEERLLNNLIAATPDHIYFKDRESRFIRVNEGFARRIGFANPSAAQGKTDFDVFGNEHASQAYADEKRIIATGQPVINKEEREDWKDGHVAWVSTTKLPMRDSAGKIVGIMGISRDITERKMADEALRRSREEFKDLFDNAPVGFHEVDAEGRLVRINNTELKMLGYTADELLGQFVWKISAEEETSRRAALAKLGGELPPPQGFERVFRRKDGSAFPVLIMDRILKREDGAILGIRAAVQDITEDKQAQEALRESQERFSTAFEHAPMGMALVSLDGRWLQVNRALCDLLGYSEAELLARTFQDITHPEDLEASLENKRKLLAGGIRSCHLEKRYLHARGSPVTTLLNVSLVRDSQGRPRHFIAQIQDLTEHKRLEAQLFQSQKMETVGRLAGGIAHEFNSLMTAIIGQSELLLGDLPAEGPLVTSATEIRQAAGQAARLTQQLLAYGRRQVLQPEILDLNHVLAGMDDILPRLMGTDVAVRIIPAAAPKAVKADAGQIEQVILNMAMNAREAMPHGGELVLATSSVTIHQENLGLGPELRPGDYVMLAITDTGTGMTEEVKKRVFEPFFTTKGVGKGAGLGLATCHGIIKQSGGHINVHSKPGAGTTFQIFLPQVEPSARIPIQGTVANELPRGTETILLAEDDSALREMAAALLRRLGYTVLVAAGGMEKQRDAGHIDLLFTDVVMPHLSAKDMAARGRAFYPHTKILFASTSSGDAIFDQSVLNQGMAHLQKPFTPSALARKVRDVLDKDKPGAAL